MREQLTQQEVQPGEVNDVPVQEEILAEETVVPTEDSAITPETPKPKFTKKQLIIGGAVLAAVAVLACIFLGKSKFEKVKDEAVQIAGQISGGKNYFTIDTYPDTYENMDDLLVSVLLPQAQENALEAIQYANEALGFNGSVYSQMLNTTALMGRQSEENDKYKVSWTYHPDDGLEVTYEKK